MAHLTSKEFLIGAAVGGLLGTVTALMSAPKSGRRLRNDIYNTCCDLSEETEDVVDKLARKGKSLIKKVSGCSCDIKDSAKCLVHGVSDWMHCSEAGCEEHHVKDLVLGSVAGGVIGAIAGLLLAPKSGAELREDIADTYSKVSEETQEVARHLAKKGKKVAKSVSNQTNEWISLAEDVIEQLRDRAEDVREDVMERGRDKMDDIMKWVSLGMRVWEHMKKRG